jgi:hypothetical protein
MIRGEIIELTIERMVIEGRYLQPAASDSVYIEDFVDHVIATLAQKLPDGEIQTCDDFKNLGIECCDGCHLYHPETGMTLVHLTDGRKAWVCCSLRPALLESDAARTTNVKVAADKAASTIASAKAMRAPHSGPRAYDLLHFDREMTAEEDVEFCVIMHMPTAPYIQHLP